MRRRPALIAVATAAACLGAVVAVPSSARLVPAEPLGAVTTITATHSGTAEVVLYDDATLSPAYTHNPDVTLRGAGRLVGFQLTRADGTDDQLVAGRMPAFIGSQVMVGGSTIPKGTCTSGPLPNMGGGCTYPKPTAILLHEGYYHLAVLTDGAPLQITIRLHGLGHSQNRIGLQRDFRAVEVNMPERDTIGTSTITYGTEVTQTGATEVGIVVAAKLHPSATVLGATYCGRRDTGAPPPYAYSPPCPNGEIEGDAYKVNLPVTNPLILGGGGVFVYTDNTSPTGVGGSFVDSDGPTYVGGLAVWVWGEPLMFVFDTPGWNL